VRAFVVAVSILAIGCARGIVHSMEAVEETEAIAPAPRSVDAAIDAEAAMADDAAEPEPHPVTCEATKTDDACFECCEAKYPKAIDIWDAALEACCPNEECSDDAYDKCASAADDLCAKDQECAGLEACEETSGCWEKVSSER
jgi:hypothetical protein